MAPTWGNLLALPRRADPRLWWLTVCLVPLNVAGMALVAVGQRELVDSTDVGTSTALLGAVALGAVGHLITHGVARTTMNLQIVIADRVDVLVNDRILAALTETDTIEHLERPDHLDRVMVLLRRTPVLARAGWAAMGVVVALAQILLSAWLLMSVHPALAALVVLSAAPLAAGWQAQRGLDRARSEAASDDRLEERLHHMVIRPETAKEIRLADSVAVLDRAADDARQRSLHVVARARLAGSWWQLAGWAVYLTALAGGMLLATRLVTEGSATLGDLMLLLTLSTQMREQVSDAVEETNGVIEARRIVGRLTWLLRYAEEHRATGHLTPPDRLDRGISLRDVRFTYPGTSEPVLRGVDLDLAAGTTVALVGVNGAGKSTLVKLLTGMYRPTSGTIHVDGTPLPDLDTAAWRARLSGAFQDFVRFEGSLRRSVGLGDLPRLDDRAAVAAALSRAGADSVVGDLPDGTDTVLGLSHGGTQLSQGQWQRLALARALMRDTSVLTVLDEPTAALDPQTEHDIYQRMAAYTTDAARGRITLLVTHRMSSARLADHIVVVDDGRITEQGDHRHLMSLGGSYARLYGLQQRAYDRDARP